MPEQKKEEIIDDQLVSTIDGYYEVVAKNSDGEPQVYRLEKHSTKTRPLPLTQTQIGELLVRQAVPNKVRPTQRRKPDAVDETHVFYGDTHHPFQDRRKLALAQLAVRELMPDTVTFLGDDNDMAMFSRFETRQEWLSSTQQGIDEFSQLLAQTRADIGKDGKIVAFQGNHDVRFEKQIREYNAELLGIKRANAEDQLGVLTLDFLLRCGELDVEYVSGYPEAEYWYNDNLKAYHGRMTRSNGLAVVTEVQGETVNFVHGHTHHAGVAYRTFRDGRNDKTIWGMETGTFADPEQIPSGSFSQTESGGAVRQLQNWQTGIGVVRVQDELIVPQFVPITDEGVMIDGRWYKS